MTQDEEWWKRDSATGNFGGYIYLVISVQEDIDARGNSKGSSQIGSGRSENEHTWKSCYAADTGKNNPIFPTTILRALNPNIRYLVDHREHEFHKSQLLSKS